MQLECHFSWEAYLGFRGLPLCSRWHFMHPSLSYHIIHIKNARYPHWTRPHTAYNLPGEGHGHGKTKCFLTIMGSGLKGKGEGAVTVCDGRSGVAFLRLSHLGGDLCVSRRRDEGRRMSIPGKRLSYWMPEMGRSLCVRKRERRPGWLECPEKGTQKEVREVGRPQSGRASGLVSSLVGAGYKGVQNTIHFMFVCVWNLSIKRTKRKK